jgi:hypothetical protein
MGEKIQEKVSLKKTMKKHCGVSVLNYIGFACIRS